jgi:hypothetical protein
MKPEKVNPRDVFFQPSRIVVPLFQRPYVWSRDSQWQPLWEDIVRLTEVLATKNPTATHFLGAFVVQQLPTNLDRMGFQSVMGAPIPVDYSSVVPSRLAEAHQYFSGAIASWLEETDDVEVRANLLVNAISGQLEIVSIRLDATEDAQAIFETLNARGVPLSAADLIKNFVFQKYFGADEEVEAAYLANWAELETPWWVKETSAGRVTFPRASWFLWHWLRARLLEDFPIRELFAQFKDYVTNVRPDLDNLLPEIKAAADRYRFIVEGSETPNGPLTRAQWFSYRVGTLDSEVVRPLTIWLDEKAQSDVPEADKDAVLRLLESWFVRRAIVKAPSQGANKLILDLMFQLSKLRHDELPKAVESYLASVNTPVGYWPDDDEVSDALRAAPAYNKYVRARLRMILEALEDHRRGYPDWKPFAMGPVTRNVGTIEHLLPQNWRVNWKPEWDAENNDEQSAQRDRTLQELGNLTLVTQGLNSRVSDGDWNSKVAHFIQANDVLLTNQVVQMNPARWAEDLVTQRTVDLTSSILEIWPAPLNHRGLNRPTSAEPPASTSVDLALLVSEGLIDPGATLVARPAILDGLTAAVSLDGRIFVQDVGYETPSAAGVAANARGSYKGAVNGWRFWKVESTGKSLWDIRNDYRVSLGEESGADELGEEVVESEQIERELVAAEEVSEETPAL